MKIRLKRDIWDQKLKGLVGGAERDVFARAVASIYVLNDADEKVRLWPPEYEVIDED